MVDPPDIRFSHHNTPTPIAGVVILVAIAVVLGSVTAVFLLDFGTQVTSTAPIADLSFEYDADARGIDDFGTAGAGFDGQLTIRHVGGQRLDASQVHVTGAASLSGARTWADSARYGPGSTIDAGSTLRVWVDREDLVSVVWIDPEGERSARLETWRGP